MNEAHIVFSVITAVFHLIFGYIVFIWPGRLIAVYKKQLLQSMEEKKPGDWRHTTERDKEVSNWFWDLFQDRALEFLKNKNKSLAKQLFVNSLPFAGVSYLMILILVVGAPNVPPLIHPNALLTVVVYPILMFIGYLLAKKNWEKFIIRGEQDKLLEEAKDMLSEKTHEDEERFLRGHD